jgi:hypothetical protein
MMVTDLAGYFIVAQKQQPKPPQLINVGRYRPAEAISDQVKLHKTYRAVEDVLRVGNMKNEKGSRKGGEMC